MEKLTIYPDVSLKPKEIRNPFFTEIKKRIAIMEIGKCVKVSLPISSKTSSALLQKRMSVICCVYSKKTEAVKKKKFSVRVLDDVTVGIYRTE